MKTRPTMQQAQALYVHRYTMEHMPAWAMKPAPNGKHYAPQFVSDAEWYANTCFTPDESVLVADGSCYTSNQTWPLGEWLEAPYRVTLGPHHCRAHTQFNKECRACHAIIAPIIRRKTA